MGSAFEAIIRGLIHIKDRHQEEVSRRSMGRRRKSYAPRMSYSDRVHMKRALLGIDYRFLTALIALVAALGLALHYLS